jgi:hypothetical protein
MARDGGKPLQANNIQAIIQDIWKGREESMTAAKLFPAAIRQRPGTGR